MTLEDDVATLERRVLTAGAIGDWRAVAAELAAAADAGDRAGVLRALQALDGAGLSDEALAAVRLGIRLGVADATGMLDADTPKIPKPSTEARELVVILDDRAVEALSTARTLAAAGDAVDVDAIAAPIRAFTTSLTSRVGDAINTAAGEGVLVVAKAEGYPVVWIAETTACVTCLAYAGMVVAHDKPFPGGLTYGKRSYFPDAIRTPPRHPHCRCTLEVLVDPEYAETLRREADRSVLRGFSLESESMSVRIEAARDLLAQVGPDGRIRGWLVPKSVLEYAQRSVDAGVFSTRDRPAG